VLTAGNPVPDPSGYRGHNPPVPRRSYLEVPLSHTIRVPDGYRPAVLLGEVYLANAAAVLAFSPTELAECRLSTIRISATGTLFEFRLDIHYRRHFWIAKCYILMTAQYTILGPAGYRYPIFACPIPVADPGVAFGGGPKWAGPYSRRQKFDDLFLGNCRPLYSLSNYQPAEILPGAKWAGQGGGKAEGSEFMPAFHCFYDFHDFQGGNCPCPCLRAPMAKSSDEGARIEAA
jgi:hypothetical protein